MSSSILRNHRLIVSKQNLGMKFYASFWAVVVFFRLLLAQPPFSFDYEVYIYIIERLNALSFSEILTTNMVFPYTVSEGIVPIEFGFSLLVKIFSSLGLDPKISFSLIASASVGLRVYTMRSLGVPFLWILMINIIAITLLEANALRLGIASSTLLFGFRQLLWSRKISAFFAMAISLTFHLQVIIFLAPFVLFYLFSGWINKSKLRLSLMLVGTSIAMVFVVQFLPMLANEKLQEYVARGTSGSSGITLTSLLAAFLLGSVAIALRTGRGLYRDSRFFSAILCASLPSAIMLVFLTNVAVIGDRAWQLAFLVLSTLFFTNWASVRSKRIPLYILAVLTLTVQVNVLARYPLSNFFSPPLPSIEYAGR